jgi:hypothetical protein
MESYLLCYFFKLFALMVLIPFYLCNVSLAKAKLPPTKLSLLNKTPSPVGDGWGEEIKIKQLHSPSSLPSPAGEGAKRLV